MTCGFKPPSHFPSNCPPLPHDENRGTYFRLIGTSANPTDADFQSFAELGRISRGQGARCKDCAISLFDTVERARNFLSNQPEFGQRRIGRVVLPGTHGVVHLTDPRSGHVEWWIPAGVSARSFFDRVEE